MPPIEPRPPIPPRIYARLCSHLEKILPASGLGTPRSRRTAATDPASGSLGGSSATRALPSRPTPTKETSLARFRGQAETPSRRAAAPATGWDASSLPPWVPPTARLLCRERGHPPLVPLVLAGAEALAAPPKGRKAKGEALAASATGLLAGVYYFASLQYEEAGTSGPEWAARAETEILAVLKKARKEVAPPKAARGSSPWEGWEDLERKSFRAAVKEVEARIEADWLDAIDELKTAVDGEEEEQDDEEEEAQDYQIARADTMFQDRYDFLTERKRAEYKVWKEGIMKRIEAIEKNGPEAMEVDT